MRVRSLALLFLGILMALPASYAGAETGKLTLDIEKKIQGLFWEGDQRQNEKRYAEAIMVYRRSLKLDPNQPDMLFRIGFCYEQMGESKKAVDYYKQALALKPDLEDARRYIEAHAQ